MTLDEFFDRLLLKNVVSDPYHALVDNRPYVAFRTLEAIIVGSSETAIIKNGCEDHKKWWDENKRLLRRQWRMMIGATVLVIAEQKARSLQRTSAIARAMPHDDVVWEQVKEVLLINQLEEEKKSG